MILFGEGEKILRGADAPLKLPEDFCLIIIWGRGFERGRSPLSEAPLSSQK
jgi:hypothetical protein